MGCIKLEDTNYMRTKDKMKIFNQFHKKTETDIPAQNKEEGFTEAQLIQLKQLISENARNPFGLTKVQLVVAIVVGILTIITMIWNVSSAWSKMEERIKSLEGSVNTLVADSSEMKDYLYADEGVKDQLGNINEALNLKVINVTDEDTVSIIDDISIEPNGISHTTSALNADMQLGVDANGHVYMAEELIGETILLTYKDEGKDVFFLGQYTEDYLWDGYCVTNAYHQDGTLYGICEMNYDNGTRLDYKTIVSSEKNAWGYYNRECSGNVNTGISIEYIFEYKKEKNFTDTNVRRQDIMYVDNFVENQEKRMTQYYVGNTSDSKYNDDTGNAYLIKFDEGGNVITLYTGRFRNGQLHDESGDAWNIVYWSEGGYYVCNKGVFRNNSAVTHSIEKLTWTEIEELVETIDIPFELKWR